jgi:VCBS repeat-containing protein
LRRTALIVVVTVGCLASFAGAVPAGAGNGRVLILRDAVLGQQLPDPAGQPTDGSPPPLVSVEHYAAASGPLFKGVDTVSAEGWSTMTTADFARYDAIVLGDKGCVHDMAGVAPAVANRDVWGPAVTGNVIIVGTDPVWNYFYGQNLAVNADALYVTQGSIGFASSGNGTGLYASLSCYYSAAPAGTHVDLLDPFGSFSVHGACTHDASLLVTNPNFDLWSDVTLSQWWDCAAHEPFDSSPADFTTVATSGGSPYILARGSGLPITPPANTAPVATDDAYSTAQETLLNVDAAAGVLTNDTDVDSNPLLAVQVTAPSHGSLALNPDGSFTYTPNAHFAGIDTFTYKANDGALDSNTATVTITVNDTEPPAIQCPSNITLPVDAGQSTAVVNYTVVALDNAGGVVTVSSNPASGTAFPVGTTTVLATATDTANNASTCWFTVTVDKRSTSTSISSSGNPSTSGQSVTFTATVKSGADPVTAGTVRFHEGAVDLTGDLPLSGAGQATLAISSLGAGSHTITADYSGTGGYEASSAQLTQVVGLRPTSLAYTGPATATLGAATALTATLTDAALGTGLAGKQVTFAVDGGAPQPAVTNAAGVASFTPGVPLGLGPHSIAIRFAGNGTYAGSTAGGAITIVGATGGGSVSGDDVKPATGGSVDMEVKLKTDRDRARPGSAELEGSFEYVANSHRLESRRITALTVAPDGGSAWFSGVAKDGRTFVVYVERGNRGSGLLKLWINGVPQTGSGALRGGSIKIKAF